MAFLRPGPNNQGMRGRMGGQVYSEAGVDTIVREFVTPANPNTGAQVGARGYFKTATQTWASLDDAERAAWGVFAQGMHSHNPMRLKQKPLSGFNVFVALASKFLQVNPAGTIPQSPPAVKFAGESIVITATPGTGKVTLTASAANTPGVTTEVLVQRLKAGYLKPEPNGYRHNSFHVYTLGNLSYDVTLGAGAWAIAVRFVKSTTGEETSSIPLPVQQVLLFVVGGKESRKSKAA